MNVEHRPIKGYEGLYSVTECGKVYSHRRDKYIHLGKAGKGYLKVNLHKNAEEKQFYVARLVVEHFIEAVGDGLEIDHIDGDKENNHVSNLRIVTRSQNCRGFRCKSKRATSKYRGVCWNKRVGKWYTQISMGDKNKFLGTFTNEEDAAKAYDKAALKRNFLTEALNY